jgi:DNA modification methylase
VLPYLDDTDFTLYLGDVRQILAQLPDESVHCVVTSPPYWGLRDYGTGVWDGGNPNCDHKDPARHEDSNKGLVGLRGPNDRPAAQYTDGTRGGRQFSEECGKCGARRVDQQLGLEPTPEQYVTNMVSVFREVRRVLRRDGTCWLNIGDSYNAMQGAGFKPGGGRNIAADPGLRRRTPEGLKPKDLVGIPWKLAFALQTDGWYLRADIIWAKPNPMPESVTDRPTKAHEYVFLLTRSPRYFFDQEAVREKYQGPPDPRDFKAGGFRHDSYVHDQHHPTRGRGPDGRSKTTVQGQDGSLQHRDGERWPNGGRNIRSVWEIATQPYAEAHFATFPEALVERCLRAGTSERGCCPECGAPKVPQIVRTPLGTGPSVDPTPLTGRKGMNRERRPDEGTREITKAEQRAYAQQLRESPHREAMAAEAGQAFAHYIRTDDSGARPLPPALLDAWLDRGWLTAAEASDCGCNAGTVPCVVLDPFIGSGTTALVARRLGRRTIGVELNPTYAELATRRLQQLSLLAPAGRGD